MQELYHQKEREKSRDELAVLLKYLPPVDFGCVYGSCLHPNNSSQGSMIDYILGVSDPEQWHSENLKMNPRHYASWIRLGGGNLITRIADNIGAGVHFNPFVAVNEKVFKYGVVRMHDLIDDIVEWKRFYLSGRLQKPVNVIVDNVDVQGLNYVNLRAATSAALLLLPSEFTEEEFYANICSLSYMGDLRMLFAEDRNKVRKIVQGQFELFQKMYKPLLQDYASKGLIQFSRSDSAGQANIYQDCGVSTVSAIISSLPLPIRSQLEMKLGENEMLAEFGQGKRELVIRSKEQAAKGMRKLVRQKVRVSSARQALAGLLTVGIFGGARYLANKVQKAWNSWM